MIEAKIGARIRELRQQTNLSQQIIAGRLGVSFQLFQQYEQGQRLAISRIIAIAEILKLAGIKMTRDQIVKYILNGDKPRRRAANP